MAKNLQPKPPYLQLVYPQKTNKTITVLCEQSVGDYSDHLELDPKDLIGKDPKNIHIRLDIEYGYYDDRSYKIVIEEIISTPNPNYNQEMKAYELALKDHERAMVEYHAAMAEYHGTRADAITNGRKKTKSK